MTRGRLPLPRPLGPGMHVAVSGETQGAGALEGSSGCGRTAPGPGDPVWPRSVGREGHAAVITVTR